MGVLMAWGPYLFETGAASFEELKDKFAGQWGKHKIFGRRPAGQYLGPDDNSVQITGTIYPNYTGEGSLQTVHDLKADVEAGTVYPLVSGDGFVFAPHRCEKGERTDSHHDDGGNPQKAVYTFDFVVHDDGDGPAWTLWP